VTLGDFAPAASELQGVVIVNCGDGKSVSWARRFV
jgi:hypothetical protein